MNATPASCSAGAISFVNAVAWRVTSSSTRARIARSCSTWSRPSGDVERTPTASCSFRPATRTWKNSSTLPLKIARNFARSSSGTDGILGQREHARLELEHRQLPVEVPGPVEFGARLRRIHASIVRAPRGVRFGGRAGPDALRERLAAQRRGGRTMAGLRIPAPTSSRRRSRRSPGSRSRTRSGWPVTSS